MSRWPLFERLPSHFARHLRMIRSPASDFGRRIFSVAPSDFGWEDARLLTLGPHSLGFRTTVGFWMVAHSFPDLRIEGNRGSVDETRRTPAKSTKMRWFASRVACEYLNYGFWPPLKEKRARKTKLGKSYHSKIQDPRSKIQNSGRLYFDRFLQNPQGSSAQDSIFRSSRGHPPLTRRDATRRTPPRVKPHVAASSPSRRTVARGWCRSRAPHA